MLSCYLGDCDNRYYLMDTQFLLVKNRTVTETCMPYTSENGTYIEKCQNEYKNGEEFIKYRSKNANSSNFDFPDNYYDVVAIIIEQLINYSPIVSSIRAYNDLYDLIGPNCKNEIYKYDGESE